MKDVQGKVAFITGAASGIGLGLAQAFLEAGMKVVLADVRRAALEAAAAGLAPATGRYHLMEVDVTDRAQMARAADEVIEVFGKVHVLCNNGGVSGISPMHEAPYEEWDLGAGCQSVRLDQWRQELPAEAARAWRRGAYPQHLVDGRTDSDGRRQAVAAAKASLRQAG